MFSIRPSVKDAIRMTFAVALMSCAVQVHAADIPLEQEFTVEMLKAKLSAIDLTLKDKKYTVSFSFPPTEVLQGDVLRRSSDGPLINDKKLIVEGKDTNIVLTGANNFSLTFERRDLYKLDFQTNASSGPAFDRLVQCWNAATEAIEIGNGKKIQFDGDNMSRSIFLKGFLEFYKENGAKQLVKIIDPTFTNFKDLAAMDRAIYDKVMVMTPEQLEATDLSRGRMDFNLTENYLNCHWP